MYLFLGAEQLGADQHGTDRERTEGLELGTISDFSEHRVEYRIETVGNTISLIRPSVFLNQEPTATTSTSTTPQSSASSTKRQKELSRKRESTFMEGPQAKIMKEQIVAVNEQVESFKRIEGILSEMNEIEKQKLEVMSNFTNVAIKWMQGQVKSEVEDDLD
jgi:hypothetical protein